MQKTTTPKTANKPTAQTVCANAQCAHNKRGTGCTLFELSAWLRCRKACIATKAARKGGTNNNDQAETSERSEV